MSGSFSHETKNDLCGVFLKKPCCKRAFLYGALLGGGGLGRKKITLCTEHEQFALLYAKMIRSVFHIAVEPKIGEEMKISTPGEVTAILSAFGYAEGEAPMQRICTDRFVCEYDAGAFLRGVFLSCGTVTEPDASYHLELMPEGAGLLQTLKGFLTENNLEPKVLRRTARREETLYYKDSSAMEDFLNFIGAQKSAFRLMNVKIMRDIRNNANRLANCDMANIDKTIAAATRQMEAIWQIAEQGREDQLALILFQHRSSLLSAASPTGGSPPAPTHSTHK
jgi:DNA-binding protein WhiA